MKKRFKKIYIEITNCCNLKCSFCPPTRRAPHFMTAGDFRRILEKIKSWTDYIYLHVKGEPLLHPDLAQILSLASEFGFYVNITTNGTLLNRQNETLMKFPVRQINISLHSFEANTFVPLEMNFQNYIMSTINFAKAFSPHHGITAFRLWNLPPESLSTSGQEQNRFILKALSESFHFTGSLEPGLYQSKDACLAPKTFLSYDREFSWPALTAPDFGSSGTCQGLKSHVAILCDGTVVPCCLDGDGVLSLGNILEQSLEDILNASRSIRILEGFRNHMAIEPLCRRCGYRTRFS
ncbi:MAG: radical SAM protein [Clostridiales bacterium]|nr:radical SAM protein [Clostridiales bacterium]